jgi:hypothetical protein
MLIGPVSACAAGLFDGRSIPPIARRSGAAGNEGLQAVAEANGPTGQRGNANPFEREPGFSAEIFAVDPVASFPRSRGTCAPHRLALGQRSLRRKLIRGDFAVKMRLVACFPKLTSSLR